MTPGARVAAAIEIFDDLTAKRRPAADALKDWGLAHRFAGSKDRSAIATLVFDALRVRASAAWIMGAETPRAVILGAMRQARDLDAAGAALLFSGEGHAPGVLSDDEAERFANATLDGAPDHVRGDYPEWLAPSFAAVFGEAAVAEGRALSARAPVDLRVNTLKTDRAKAANALAHLNVTETPWSPVGLRGVVGPDGRGPSLAAEPAYAKGLVEVQDEGSQLAAILAAPEQRGQVLDLCAGGGGKTLAMAALMDNKGQIYATDSDGRRLMPILPRLERAGARNVQVRSPRGRQRPLDDLVGRCDLVLVDAPCTGTGAWRRNPDAKWRTRPGALQQRIQDQDTVLDEAVRFLKHGGRLVYVTCSVLREENEDRVTACLERHSGLLPVDAAHMARRAGLDGLAGFASRLGPGLRLTPATTGTDGFFVATLLRAPA